MKLAFSKSVQNVVLVWLFLELTQSQIITTDYPGEGQIYTNIGQFDNFKSPAKKVDTTVINVIYLLLKKNLSKNTKMTECLRWINEWVWEQDLFITIN